MVEPKDGDSIVIDGRWLDYRDSWEGVHTFVLREGNGALSITDTVFESLTTENVEWHPKPEPKVPSEFRIRVAGGLIDAKEPEPFEWNGFEFFTHCAHGYQFEGQFSATEKITGFALMEPFPTRQEAYDNAIKALEKNGVEGLRRVMVNHSRFHGFSLPEGFEVPA